MNKVEPIRSIEKIKKDGAFTALIASFEEGCDKIREDWEILYLEDWDEIRVKTLKAINRLDLIVAAIKELEPVETEESKPEGTEEDAE